jgi:hypothetical protein
MSKREPAFDVSKCCSFSYIQGPSKKVAQLYIGPRKSLGILTRQPSCSSASHRLSSISISSTEGHRLQEKTPITFDAFKSMLSGLQTYITDLQAKVTEVELPEFSSFDTAPFVKEDVELVSLFAEFLGQYEAANKSGVSSKVPEFDFEAFTADTKKAERRLQGEKKYKKEKAYSYSKKNSYKKAYSLPEKKSYKKLGKTEKAYSFPKKNSYKKVYSLPEKKSYTKLGKTEKAYSFPKKNSYKKSKNLKKLSKGKTSFYKSSKQNGPE